MARIRSIHPNITTDPDYAEMPRDARLMGIYSLTVADDAGNLEGSSRALKMSCFPGDDDLTPAMIAELRDIMVAGRFYLPYDADGKQYLHIRNFSRYQKLDHPTAPKVPLAPGQTYTYHIRRGNTFEPKTERGPLPEQHTNSTLTAPERTVDVSVPFAQEGSGLGLGLEGDGKDLDGKEGRGPGRGTEQPASPPSATRNLGGEISDDVAVTKPDPLKPPGMKGSGNGLFRVRKEYAAVHTRLSPEMKDALDRAIGKARTGDWTWRACRRHLLNEGFGEKKATRAMKLFVFPKAN